MSLLVYSLLLSSLGAFLAADLQPLPIVFVYTVVSAVCQHGLPDYIRVSLEHTIYTQPDCHVVLLANVGECPQIAQSVKNVAGLTVEDCTALTSNRTTTFLNASADIFQTDNSGELWITSALRFFLLEDLMLRRGYSEVLHVEADNLLYGRVTSLLPTLRKHFLMAVTPMNTRKSFLTASVFWVSRPKMLVQFNDFLLYLSGNHAGFYDGYLDWLRPLACCKPGGVRPGPDGNGIKPFAINEMSMLAYFHELRPEVLRLLPVVPAIKYFHNRNIPDAGPFSPGGSEIVSATGKGIWDPGSWGQYLGGTPNKKGRNKGFTDATHIAGIAMRVSPCRPTMLCGNVSEFDYVAGSARAGVESRCYTLPVVSCGEGQPLYPLWNLHVHSKHTSDYRSVPCACSNASTLML
eukprot:gene5710-6294_t